MKNPSIIFLRLNSVDEILLANPAGYTNRRLNKDAEEFISKAAFEIGGHDILTLNIQIPPGQITRSNDITNAIHQHFALCRETSVKRLKYTLRLGWRSLLIGFMFLSLMILLTSMVKGILPKSVVGVPLQETLIILGWVALWRPADLLLYEWYPYRRDANLFKRLEVCDVNIVAG